MKTIGLFEAKTKLSEICQMVSETGQSIRITRRGQSVAILTPPVPSRRRESVWDARERYEREHGPLTEELSLPVRRISRRKLKNPLD